MRGGDVTEPASGGSEIRIADSLIYLSEWTVRCRSRAQLESGGLGAPDGDGLWCRWSLHAPCLCHDGPAPAITGAARLRTAGGDAELGFGRNHRAGGLGEMRGDLLMHF